MSLSHRNFLKFYKKLEGLQGQKHCVKSVQIRSVSVFGLNMGRCGPEETPYLDIFRSV